MSHWALENNDQAQPTPAPTLNQAMSTILKKRRKKKSGNSQKSNLTQFTRKKLWKSARLKWYIH